MTEIRLDALAAALREPGFDFSPTEAAASAGFAGLNEATRAFMKRFGTTMSRYRATMISD